MVTVYRFKLEDPQTGDWVVKLSKATEWRIGQLGGQVIASSAEEVPDFDVNQDGYHQPRKLGPVTSAMGPS